MRDEAAVVIMHVITNFSAPNGAEAMLARLLRVSEEEKIIVAPLIDASAENRELASNPNVVYAPQNARSMPALVAAAIGLARLIRRERPKLILCWMYHAMVIGTLGAKLAACRTPIFWNVRQSLDDLAALSRSTRIGVALSRLISGLPSGTIYNSTRALTLHEQYGFRNANAIVIPNGFELPDHIKPQRKKPSVIGIAGRFHPQKDHSTFFHAVARLAKLHPQARFIAAGSGLTQDNPQVISMIEEAGLPLAQVELRGRLETMSQFYREIDLLVLSSRTEGFPNVVAEAMSYARPVVTTDVGDAVMIVGSTGIAVPPRDPEQLAAAIEQMLDLSSDAYFTRAEAARRRVETKYSLAAVAEQYRTFLGL